MPLVDHARGNSEARRELFATNVATESCISTPRTAIDSLVWGDERHCSHVAVYAEAEVLVTTDCRGVHVPVASVKLHDVAEPTMIDPVSVGVSQFD